jgi:TonB dependent receptor/TonB-dependent Receptor Plug Domain
MKHSTSVALLAAGAVCGTALAHGPGGLSGAPQRISVTGHYDNRVGSSDAASQGTIGAALLESRPALRPGEILEFVPGVIVTQHSGDGKANQYFLRGFNLDHGTDFATRVAGVPVNLPSHGHGQGYADLNFLIPEMVQRIEYRKGPYFAANGDFSAAGAAEVAYKRALESPFGQLSLGRHGFRRAVAGRSLEVGASSWIGALELQAQDGPWTVPEDQRKHSLALGVSAGTNAQGWSLMLLDYANRWTATDQVPERAIRSGRIGRFGSLDPTTGGTTHRTSVSADWRDESETTRTQIGVWALAYRLDLNSNFTYALERPDDGDQFKQTDRRRAFGSDGHKHWDHRLFGREARTEFGYALRHDRVRVGLFDSVARRIVTPVRDDELRVSSGGVYVQTALELAPKWRGVFGLRADQWHGEVDAISDARNSGRARDRQVSPRLALIAGPWAKTELFFNAGRGLHSNDARGTTARFDPRSGDAVETVQPLAALRGAELGLRTEAVKGLQTSLALWQLNSKSELVYVGDAGTTEAGPASRRRGLEWNNRWLPTPWLLFDADFAWSHARFATGERITNAVERVASLAATIRDLGPWSASLQVRHLGPAPLIEDNSVRSPAVTTANLRLAWNYTGDQELTLDVFNLTNRRVDDIQYFYESRLPGEADAVADRHVHPAEPRGFRITWRIGF